MTDEQWNLANNQDCQTKQEREARERLIAAAPDLLEALKEAHRALTHYQWYDEDAHGVRARNEAAIAKAAGK